MIDLVCERTTAREGPAVPGRERLPYEGIHDVCVRLGMSSLQDVSTPSSTVAAYGAAARALKPAETITNIDAMPCGYESSQRAR